MGRYSSTGSTAYNIAAAIVLLYVVDNSLLSPTYIYSMDERIGVKYKIHSIP